MEREITVGMIDALETLRAFRTGQPTDKQVADAIDVLDNAGFFTEIDEAALEEETRYAQTMASLLGVDLNDRYPKGDENGIIHPRRD